MSLFHIVSKPDGQQVIVRDEQLNNGKMRVRCHDEDYDGDSYYDEWISVEIDCSYLVQITAQFIMNPQDNYKSPMYRYSGAYSTNHLAYTYSVNVIECFKSWTLYTDEPIYSKTGIGTTNFNMYSYHTMNGTEVVYDNSRLEYEVYCKLDLEKILLPDQK